MMWRWGALKRLFVPTRGGEVEESLAGKVD